MGLEILAAALTIGSIYQGMETAEDEATATIREGELKAGELSKSTAAKAAAQKASFLSSGFTMEGTPSAVLSSTYSTGKEDISQLLANYESQANLTMSKAKTSALSSLAGLGASAYTSGMFDSMAATATDFFGSDISSYMSDDFLFSANTGGAGSTAYEAFDIKDSRY